jgi:hypothetical protein
MLRRRRRSILSRQTTVPWFLEAEELRDHGLAPRDHGLAPREQPLEVWDQTLAQEDQPLRLRDQALEVRDDAKAHGSTVSA